MTSNLGVKKLKDFGQGVGFATEARTKQADDHAKSVIQGSLKKTFSPEFLNRIDDIVIFNSLEEGDILKIVDLALNTLHKRIEDMGFKIKLSKAAKEFLAAKGYDPAYGARPLHRAIQKYVEDPLAEKILAIGNKPGSTFKIGHSKDSEELKITEVVEEKESEADKVAW